MLQTDLGNPLRALLKRIRAEGDPVARWKATAILVTSTPEPERRVKLMREALANPSASCRLLALEWMNSPVFGPSDTMRLRTDLARMATKDADPANRAFAQSILRQLAAAVRARDAKK